MRKSLMALDISERYEVIRNFQAKFQLSPTQASQNLGVCYQTVVNANTNMSPKRYEAERKLQECHRIFIHVKTLLDPHVSDEKLAKMIQDEFEINVSYRTVNRIRNEMKLQYRPPIRSVFISPEAATKRKDWTAFHLANGTHFMNVAFTDESWFQLDRNRRWVWVDKQNLTDGMFSKSKAHPKKVMIWGAIGWNFKSELIIIDKSVNTEYYIDKILLESSFIDDADRCWGAGNWIFQQDNAPAHRSAETIAVLKELGIDLLKDWPPYSPDLNIIEVVWAIMKVRVEQREPKDLDELKNILIEVWNDLAWPTINGLVSSMKDRLIAVNNAPDKTIWQLTKAH